jgi:fibronectin type 3 domain-containing protein
LFLKLKDRLFSSLSKINQRRKEWIQSFRTRFPWLTKKKALIALPIPFLLAASFFIFPMGNAYADWQATGSNEMSSNVNGAYLTFTADQDGEYFTVLAYGTGTIRLSVDGQNSDYTLSSTPKSFKSTPFKTGQSLKITLLSGNVSIQDVQFYSYNWTNLDTQSNVNTWNQNEKRTFPITDSNSYQTFRLLVTDTQNGQAPTVGELELDNQTTGSSGTSAIPTMTSNTAPSGQAIASNEYAIWSCYAYKAFNGVKTSNDGWFTQNIPSGWLEYVFPSSQTINKYTIYGYNYAGYNDRNPKDWTFEGSDDGTTWTVLDTQTGVTNWNTTSGYTKTFNFANSTAYHRYRINVSANNGNALLAITELQMFTGSSTGYANVVPMMTSNNSPAPVTISDFSGSTKAWKAFNLSNIDGSDGWNGGSSLPQWIRADLGSGNGKALSQYSITSTNAATRGDLKSWTLQGANTLQSLDKYSTSLGWSGMTMSNTIPSVPSGLSATPGDKQVNLSWAASTDTNTIGYNLYRNGTKINTSVLTGTSYNDTGLTNGTTYSYTLTGVNGNGGESAQSSSVTATPKAVVTAAPTGLTATPGDKQVNLAWDSVTGATGYNLYRGGVKLNSTPMTGTSYLDNAVTNGTAYSYTVSSVNSDGVESAQSTAVTATPIAALTAVPTGLTATPGDKQVNLTWNNVTGAMGYNLYRGGVKLNSTPMTGTSYLDTGLTNGTAYSYTVTSVNSDGVESAQSTAVSVTPKAAVTAVPTGLTATSGDKQVNLVWNSVTGATGYNLYRGGVKLNSTPMTGTSYLDTGLTNGTAYSYTVTSVNSDGVESAQSTAVSATPKAAVTAVPTGLTATSGDNQATLNWNSVTGATGYNLYENGVFKVNDTPITANTYVDTSLTNGTQYSFTVTSVNADGVESAQSSPVTVTPKAPLCLVPTGLKATAGNGQVSLTWNQNLDLDFSSYNVYQDGLKINTSPVTTNSYTAISLANGTSYKFTVAAVNTDGAESGQSDPVSATPQLPPPPPPPGGIDYSTGSDGTGTYLLITWDSVTGAQSYVVSVNGQVVATVPSDTTQYKYYNPPPGTYYKIGVVTSDGTQSSTTGSNPSEYEKAVKWNIGPLDIIQTAFNFLNVFSNFILIGMVFLFAPRLTRFIKALSKKNGVKF